MLGLNQDVLKNILFYFEIKDILATRKICKHIYDYYKSDDMIQILSLKLDMKGATLKQLLLRCHRNTIMPIITLLAQLYHVNTGILSFLDLYKPLHAKSRVDEYISIVLNNGGKIYKKCYGEITTDLSRIRNYDYITLDFAVPYVETQLQTPIHFKTVILKYENSKMWPVKPRVEWYNEQPAAYWARHLPLLNTKPWITIDEPFMQITISAESKGTILVVDDILFAIRGLAPMTGTVVSKLGNYRILNSDDYDVLCIEPDIY